MQHLALLATICGLHTLAVISPGPDFLLALKNSLTYSRRTGIYTAIGFALGIATHLIYCITGLAFLISKSILLFNILKYIGAGYLMYIGIKSIMSKPNQPSITGGTFHGHTKKSDITPFKAIKSGYLTNLLNPKATLFMLSIFTLVIKPETPAFVLIGASAYMIAFTAIWFSLVAVFFSHLKIQNTYHKFESVINKTFGGLLMLLGIKLALANE
ncbi:MAG: LysE family transporter [Candidatus Gracilibacteria bacterium]